MIARPHTATLATAAQTPSGAGKIVPPKTVGTAVSMKCFVQPMGPDAAFAAIGLQLSRPYRVFTDLTVGGVAIETAATVGSHIVWNGITLIVQAVRPYRYGSSLDHATLYCEEKQR